MPEKSRLFFDKPNDIPLTDTTAVLQAILAADYVVLRFHCPGCNMKHAVPVKSSSGPVWDFNGDLDKPTLEPSLLLDQPDRVRCHLFLRNGTLQFCEDSAHALKGQTVPLPDYTPPEPPRAPGPVDY